MAEHEITLETSSVMAHSRNVRADAPVIFATVDVTSADWPSAADYTRLANSVPKQSSLESDI